MARQPRVAVALADSLPGVPVTSSASSPVIFYGSFFVMGFFALLATEDGCHAASGGVVATIGVPGLNFSARV